MCTFQYSVADFVQSPSLSVVLEIFRLDCFSAIDGVGTVPKACVFF